MPSKPKKQSKLSSLWSKVKPNTPAKKLLAFVLVFGVIAGGYFAYQSFASSRLYINASYLCCGRIVTDNSSSNKRGVNTLKTGVNSIVTIKSEKQGVLWAKQVRACVTARRDGTSAVPEKAIIKHKIDVYPYTLSTSEAWYTGNSNYKSDCTNWVSISNPYAKHNISLATGKNALLVHNFFFEVR